jgi:hypothetical protein
VSGTAITLTTNLTDASYATADCTDYGPLVGITQLAGDFSFTHLSATVLTSVSQVGIVNVGDILWFGADSNGSLGSNPTFVVSSLTSAHITLTSNYDLGTGTFAGTNFDLGASPPTQFNSSATWNPGAIPLNNEYLFFQLAFYSDNEEANYGVRLVQDPANSVIITPGWTVP